MTEILIIGAGLCGLALARHLNDAGVDFHLLEARDRLGGRIQSAQDGEHVFDMGPSWYWPGQTKMARLVTDLSLRTFEQYAAGDAIFEPSQGGPQRVYGYGQMAGSFRLEGGMMGLIDGLARLIPRDRITLNAPVVTVTKGKGVTLADGTKFHANKVVVTCPPRVAATLRYTPNIDLRALFAIPTWMGGQAKFIATYDTPFWRNEGLSGDAMSRRGPLVEIHDASPNDMSLGALFGFVGVAPQTRMGQSEAIIAAALDQLTRLFGETASSPRITRFEDWATQPHTATPEDQTPLNAHPAYGLPAHMDGLWDGGLHFGSTETAHAFGGFLEGALVRAETLAKSLLA